MIRTLSKLIIEGNFLSLMKNIYKKPIANIIINDEKMEAFQVRSGTRQEGPLSLLLFSIALEILVDTIRHKYNKTKKVDKTKLT